MIGHDPAKTMEEILALDEQIDFLHQTRNDLLQAWAESVCPYHVGEVTTVKSNAHKGRQCKITRIIACHSWPSDGYVWLIEAVVLIKNGRPGKLRVSWSEESERRVATACRATTLARTDANDDGKYRECELCAGHKGEHKTTYCGRTYRWKGDGE